MPRISEANRSSGRVEQSYVSAKEIGYSPWTCSIGRPAGDTLCARPTLLQYGVVGTSDGAAVAPAAAAATDWARACCALFTTRDASRAAVFACSISRQTDVGVLHAGESSGWCRRRARRVSHPSDHDPRTISLPNSLVRAFVGVWPSSAENPAPSPTTARTCPNTYRRG